MKIQTKLSTALAFALALSAPLAFAQDAATPAQPQSTGDAMQSEPAQPATDAATGAPQTAPTAPTAAQPAGEPKQITWADLDGDKDGKLTKTEAASVQALTQVFDDADADKDGALTPDEYKAFVAKNQGKAATGSEG